MTLETVLQVQITRSAKMWFELVKIVPSTSRYRDLIVCLDKKFPMALSVSVTLIIWYMFMVHENCIRCFLILVMISKVEQILRTFRICCVTCSANSFVVSQTLPGYWKEITSCLLSFPHWYFHLRNPKPYKHNEAA